MARLNIVLLMIIPTVLLMIIRMHSVTEWPLTARGRWGKPSCGAPFFLLKAEPCTRLTAEALSSTISVVAGGQERCQRERGMPPSWEKIRSKVCSFRDVFVACFVKTVCFFVCEPFGFSEDYVFGVFSVTGSFLV